MGRLIFDPSGKLVGVDGKESEPRKQKTNYSDEYKPKVDLKTSDSLSFLKAEPESKSAGDIFEKSHWSLFFGDKKVEPFTFSNGKTQEDVVKEILNLIKEGNKVIFLHGTCGTGKSAIALNLARALGKASIVVPVKALQKQYEEDYMGEKYVNMTNGKKMKIAMITGRGNHDSVISPGLSCADPTLPENIKFTERNFPQLSAYYEENPYVSNKEMPDVSELRRISIAPANPYWSPILPADFEVKFDDARKKKYKAIGGKDYIFYHRKPGCSYYDQFLSYTLADVIIFNSAKYLSEMDLGRKPQTEIEIIDEADSFLDSLFQQDELNLSRFASSLKLIYPETVQASESKRKILDLLSLEEQNKHALGIDENQVYQISETKIKDILNVLTQDSELASEIAIDEINYANKILEAARKFKNSIADVYLTYRKSDDNLLVKLVTTNLSAKFKELVDKNKALVLMSGTLHSKEVLEHIFGIKDFKIVEAETLNLGSMEILRTGKEFDCKYANFKAENHTREEYLESLSQCVEKANTPFLVHVNAFQDLPNETEKSNQGLIVMSSERLRQIQSEDKVGRNISIFKQGLSESLYSTKCSRGADFPGDLCNSIIFTKYPNPNVSDTFWKILQKTHPSHYWEFYRDKARREFLQRIYRAVRSKDDHVFILSPDIRVLNAVRDLQVKMTQAQK